MSNIDGTFAYATKGASEPVTQWFARIKIGQNALAKNFTEKAKRNINYYLGNQYDDPEKAGRVPLNWVASLVDSLVPGVYSRNPRVLVRPKILDKGSKEMNMQNRLRARMFEVLLNKTIDEIKFKRTMKRVIKDAVLGGRGILKVGYSGIKGKKEGKKISFSLKGLFTGKKQAEEELPGVPADTNQDDIYLKSERAWAERISPFLFFYDPDATDLDHAKWAVQECKVSLAWAKACKLFNNGAQLVASSYTDADYLENVFEKPVDETWDGEGAPEDCQKVTLYEIWDKETRMVYVLAKNNESLGFIRETEWPYEGMEGFPYTELVPIEVPDSQWGEAEVNRIIEGQDEFNMIRDMMGVHVHRALAGWVAEKGAMDKDDLQKWSNGEIMETFLMNDITKLKSLAPPQMPQDYYNYSRALKDDMDENSKMPSWKRAGTRIGARSATEVAEVTQGLDVITNEKVDVVQDFSVEVLKKLAQVIQEKYRLSHIVPVVGTMAEAWTEFEPRQIKEELDISVIPYSATPVNPDIEKAQYLQFVPLMAQAQMAGVPVNMVVFLRKIADKLQISDVEEFLGPDAVAAAGGDPAVQAMLSQSLAQGGQGGTPGQAGPARAPGGASMAPRNLMQ